MKILIVDDSKIMRTLIKKAVNAIGYEVIAEASNGTEAIELYPAHNPDIVLLDINMPGIDGVETARKLTSQNENTNIIMISARGEFETITDAMKAGAKAYINKPVDNTQLKETIAQVTKQKNDKPTALIADSAVVFRKSIAKILTDQGIANIAECKDGLEALLEMEKNPNIRLMVLNDELLGLPTARVLEVLDHRDLLVGKELVLLTENHTSCEIPRKAIFLGHIEKSSEPSELKSEIKSLINPPQNSHPQYLLIEHLISSYLKNEHQLVASKKRINHITNTLLDDETPLEKEELFLLAKHIATEYLAGEEKDRDFRMLSFRTYINGAYDSNIYSLATDAEFSSSKIFTTIDEAKSYLAGCEGKKIEADYEPSRAIRAIFAPVFDFFDTTLDHFSFDKNLRITYKNFATLMDVINRNQKVKSLSSKEIFPYLWSSYSYLHKISQATDHPNLISYIDKIESLQKIESNIKDIFNNDFEEVYHENHLARQSKYQELKDIEADHDALIDFEADQRVLFKQEFTTSFKKLYTTTHKMLDFFVFSFFAQLIDLCKKDEKLSSHFLSTRSDIFIFDLFEKLLVSLEEKNYELLEKMQKLRFRHILLISSSYRLTEQFEASMHRKREWKFNRINDPKLAIRWLEANSPTHIFVDSELVYDEKTPLFEAMAKELPFLKTTAKITLIISEKQKEEIKNPFANEINLPINDELLAKRIFES